MKCFVVNDLLPEYMENLCSAETKEEIEKHIAGCKKCRQKLKDMSESDLEATEDLSENGKEDIHPFAKIQAKMKKEKKKRIGITIVSLILIFILAILGFFQIRPDFGGPNYDMIGYYFTAKQICNEMSKGNMEVVLDGINNWADLSNHINFDLYGDEAEFYEATANKLKEAFKDYEGSKVEIEYIEYMDGGFYNYKVNNDQETQIGRYCVGAKFIKGDKNLNVFIDFLNKDCYEIMLDSWDGAEGYDEQGIYIGKQIEFYSSVLIDPKINDYICDVILQKEDRKSFTLLSRRFVKDCNKSLFVEDLNEQEKARMEGEVPDYECTDYFIQVENAFHAVHEISTTQYFRFEDIGFDKEKQAIESAVIWKLADKNGKKAFFTKKFYHGMNGYEAVDDTEEIYAEDGFDANLQNELETMFD